MSLRKNAWIIPVAAILGIAVLAVIGATQTIGQKSSGYVLIDAWGNGLVCLQFQGSELRAAATVEGLKTAQPVKMRQQNGSAAQFPEIVLPIPANELPAGITAVKASFMVFPQPQQGQREGPTAYVRGNIAITRTDSNKAVWQYSAYLGSPNGPAPDKAPVMQLPGLDKLTLSVTGKPANGSLGLGVSVLAGTTQLGDVTKDGRPVETEVTVLDAAGKVASSKKGPLSAFGFG